MRLAILCPGQGDQSAHMFDSLRADAQARAVLDETSDFLGEDIFKMTTARMMQNALAQPIICAVEMACYAALKPHLPEPIIFAGYSVGELAAYGCAEALSVAQILSLAQTRARLMDVADATHGNSGTLMAVRGILQTRLTALCENHACEVAIVNAEDKIVVGGARENLQTLNQDVEALGGKTTPLSITIASHTSQMQSAVVPFAEALSREEFAPLTAPILAGLDGGAVYSKVRAIETLSMQIAKPVRFDLSLERISEMGTTVALELLPGNGLSHMMSERFDADSPTPILCRAVSEFRSLDGVISWIEKNITQG